MTPDKLQKVKELCADTNLTQVEDWLELEHKDLGVLNEARLWTMSLQHFPVHYTDTEEETVPACSMLDQYEEDRHSNPEKFSMDEDDEDYDMDNPENFGEFEVQPRRLCEDAQDYTYRMLEHYYNSYGEFPHSDERYANLVCAAWYNYYKVNEPYLEGDIYHNESDGPYGMEQFTTTIREFFNLWIRPLCVLKILNEDVDDVPYGMRLYSADSVCKLDAGVGICSVLDIWKWLGGTSLQYSSPDTFPENVSLLILKLPKDVQSKYRQWMEEYVANK